MNRAKLGGWVGVEVGGWGGGMAGSNSQRLLVVSSKEANGG